MPRNNTGNRSRCRSCYSFGHTLPSNDKLIKLFVSFIKKYDEEIDGILVAMHELVDTQPDEPFVKQIHLIETFKGAGFLSAVTVMCEIGDFSVFKSPNSFSLTSVLILREAIRKIHWYKC